MNNYLASTMAAAVLASAGLCASALAQDKAAPAAQADKTQVVPGKTDPTPAPAATIEKMGDNAQRIHARDSAAGLKGSASKAQAGANPGQQARTSSPAVRDWAAIDTNKDNSISPEEMEAALKEGGSPANPVPVTK